MTRTRTTAGSVENLALLNGDEAVDLGFVQGGLGDHAPSENVVAIGSLYLEPLWLFVHSDIEIEEMGDFIGKQP